MVKEHHASYVFHIAKTNERHFPLSCMTELWHGKKEEVPPHVCSLCWYSIPLTRVVQFDLFSHSFVTLSTIHVSKLCCQVHFYFRRLASLSGIAIPSYLYQHITNSDEGMDGKGVSAPNPNRMPRKERWIKEKNGERGNENNKREYNMGPTRICVYVCVRVCVSVCGGHYFHIPFSLFDIFLVLLFLCVKNASPPPPSQKKDRWQC